MDVLMTLDEIKAWNNRKFADCPLGTDDVVSIKDIEIPKDFLLTIPHEYKVQNAVKSYVKFGMLDKPISVYVETNEKGRRNKIVLVDGYSRYIAAIKWLSLKFVPIKYIEIY